MEKDSARVRQALADEPPIRSAGEARTRVIELLEGIDPAGKIDSKIVREATAVLRDAVSWSRAHRHGIEELRGEELTAAKELLGQLAQMGLHLVPKGDLEGWWHEGPPDKAAWFVRAVEELESDPATFDDAVAFMREVRDSLAATG